MPKPIVISMPDTFLSSDIIKKRKEILNTVFKSTSFILRINSSGCFHDFTQQYIFIQKDSIYNVLYKEKSGYKTKFPKEYITYAISKKTFETFKIYCFHGLEIGTNLCTNSKYFSFSDNKHKTYFVDARCDHDDDIMQNIADLIGVKQTE